MKSREAIRNTILSYTSEIWGTQNIERLDILIKVMIETLTNELYLVQDKLEHIDQSLLERIAHKLTPEKFVSVRPAHTLLHAKPDVPMMTLKQEHQFNLDKIPEDFINSSTKIIVFHPSCDFNLFDIQIDYLFLYRSLYKISNGTQKTLLSEAITPPIIGNSIWIGMTINPEVENLRNLTLHFNFPSRSEIDDAYDLLPYTRCSIGGKEVKLVKGLPVLRKSKLVSDQAIVDQVSDSYLHIGEDVLLSAIEQELLPIDLFDSFSVEQKELLSPKIWMKLEFFPYINLQMLQEMQLLFNVFPVTNRRLMKTSISKNSFSNGNVLDSAIGEELLAINTVIDAEKQPYQERENINDIGTFMVDNINRVRIGSLSVVEYVEQLLDRIDEERVAFKGINRDLVEETLFLIKGDEAFNESKAKRNARKVASTLSKVYINAHEDIRNASADYWVTYGESINLMPVKLNFQPDKINNLERIVAHNITPIDGAKAYTRFQDLIAIDRYLLSSKDRIVSAVDVENFCKAELRDAVDTITVRLEGKESPMPKQGLVKVIRVELRSNKNELNRYGTLRSLKTRMQKRSPGDYVYDIIVMTN
ncbi:MAG: hypothetical protein ACK5L5_12045 [Bacteroidales bacterium]